MHSSKESILYIHTSLFFKKEIAYTIWFNTKKMLERKTLIIKKRILQFGYFFYWNNSVYFKKSYITFPIQFCFIRQRENLLIHVKVNHVLHKINSKALPTNSVVDNQSAALIIRTLNTTSRNCCNFLIKHCQRQINFFVVYFRKMHLSQFKVNNARKRKVEKDIDTYSVHHFCSFKYNKKKCAAPFLLNQM